jgi:hypothetical protein
MEVNMKVYHLKVQAYSNMYGELIERDSFFSEVYSNLDKAVENGRIWIKNKIQELYEKSDYCVNGKNTLTMKDFLDDNKVSYNFRIIEFDPEYAENFETPLYEFECKNLEPTHIIYYYDLEGKLLYKDLEYRSNKGGFAHVFTRYPDDDENKPNKFEIGDFVTVIDDDYIPSDQPCVIYAVPNKNDPKRYFENTYCISTISNGCRFEFYHEHNESRLQKYEGKIAEDSPLMLLKKLYRNEIQLDKEILEKIETNEIILNTKPTYKDIIKF